ncbi:MAG: outer membrane beta-barrel protein [Rickettsiales bacterium]|nr:outer membrane beta-barrel protein [Rickettsiales bacterium]
MIKAITPGYRICAKLFAMFAAAIGFCSGTAAAAEKVYRNIYSEPKKMIMDDGAPSGSGNYFGAGISYAFATFEQKHAIDGTNEESEKYSTAAPAGALFLGTSMGENYRGEIEAGVVSKYADTRDDAEFSIQTYYILASGAWDFYKGFHLNGGLGLAASDMRIKSEALFSPASVSDTSLSPMIAVGFGYRVPVSDKWTIDFSYRFSGFWGAEQTIGISGTASDYSSDVGFIASHQVGVGASRAF